jgi:malate permease and related proteins
MSPAITKTFYLILIIVIGYLLQKKISTKDQKDGIKILILSLALPATIFIALLKIQFSIELILVPILAIGFNFILFGLLDKLPFRSILNIPEKQYRSLTLLLPSLAPGLSCFPFIAEYSGESSLALVALADMGNKIFVLVVAYSIAMNWYFKINNIKNASVQSKVKDLAVSLVSEPVNVMMIIATIMLAIGLDFETLPGFIQLSIDKIGVMMTPLILLFIGISMNLTLQQIQTIVAFLFLRSGLAFFISGLLILILPPQDLPTILLIIVFPQSASSFWPFAHMVTVSKLEKKQHKHDKTFDLDFGMNILACSLPFSVILILGIYSSGQLFANPSISLGTGVLFIALAALPVLFSSKRSKKIMFTNKSQG